MAADANLSGHMYPDQSLYPVNSVPGLVRAINNSLVRADQKAHAEGHDLMDWMLPIVADAQAGSSDAKDPVLAPTRTGPQFRQRLSAQTRQSSRLQSSIFPARISSSVTLNQPD